MCSGPEPSERPLLLAVVVEVFGGQPALEAAFEGGPLGVDDRKPGGVAAFAFHNAVLAEKAFILEAEAEGCCLGCFVAVVALPLEPPVAELIEGMGGKEVEGLSRHASAGDGRTPINGANLNTGVLWKDTHVGLP